MTGEALLQKVKTFDTLSKEQKAKACGYYTVTKGGVERVSIMQFRNALIEADGIELDGKATSDGRAGRSVNYRISVQASGNLLLGVAYTKQMALQPGDEFALVLRWKYI